MPTLNCSEPSDYAKKNLIPHPNLIAINKIKNSASELSFHKNKVTKAILQNAVNTKLSPLKIFVLAIVLLFSFNSYSQTVTKHLYLSDSSQSLDLIDPVATSDTSTAQSNLLYTNSTPITVENYYYNKTDNDAYTITVPNVVVGTDSNRLMLVGLSVKGTNPDQITNYMTVTYAGQTASPIDQTPDGNATVLLFALVNPPSGTADVVVDFGTAESKKGIVVGVTNMSGVDQTTPLGPVVKAQDIDVTNLSLTVSSAPGELVYDIIAMRNRTITAASTRQTIFYNEDSGNELVGASSIKPGATSVTMDWTVSSDENNAMAAVAIKPVMPNTTATFIQTPAICNTLTIKGGHPITVSNYLSVMSGSMPANPSITAELKYGGTNIITLSNPTYNSGTGLLTFTGSLGSDIAIPAGQSIALTVTTAEPNVSFYIDYDSQTKPSKIEFSMDSGSNIFPPEIPSLISGNISPSTGTSQIYSVTNEPGLTYNWVLPSGWTQTAGGTTNAITVTVGSLSGSISVTPNNGSCDGDTQVLSLFTAIKQLYLSDPSQALDRIDPVATNDTSTASSPILTVGSSVTVDLIATKDTGIKLKKDSENYGSCTSIEIDRETTDSQRMLVQFDLSSIPVGATIESAELKLNCTSGADMDVSVFKIGSTDAWDEGTLCVANGASNWLQRNSTSNWSAEGAIGPNSNSGTPLSTIDVSTSGIQTWPVTCLVEDWVSGAATNNGMALSVYQAAGGMGNRIATYDTRETTTGVKPTLSVTYSLNAVSFKQTPSFCSPFTIKEGTPITITNYVNVVSGSMPSNPDITAILKTNCSNTIITITDPSYNATTNLITWSGSLGADVTIPAGEAIILVVGSNESGVDFTIDYDSQSKPSKVEFSTSTFIDMSSYEVYDAPYPGGSIITSAEGGSMVYLRAEVSDPFGAYDITDLTIDNQGTPVVGTIVASTSCSNTYEYSLFTPSTSSTYSYPATAKEGYENTVTDSMSLDLTITSSKIDFDGTDDHIDFGNVHGFTSPFSLEAWVLQEGSVGTKTVISKTNTSPGNESGYQLAIIEGIPNLKFFDGSGNTVLNISTSPYTLSNNKWFHLAATFDGTTAKLFVDGVELASGDPSAVIGCGTESFLIGASYNSNTPTLPTKYFDGFIDEVRIWNVALTEQQIHEMMNQEIKQNGTFVQGTVIPSYISGGLLWSNLESYYTLDENVADDKSNNNHYGVKKNINSIQTQSAPLPYTTKADGDWTDLTSTTPWTHGNTVWNYPNSAGIDGSNINWNIVVTNNNVEINNDTEVLGLVVGSNEIKVNGVTNKTAGSNTGNTLIVTTYLKLDGSIDLEGESQLIQTDGCDLDSASSGTLERDQQGTADAFTYNYWSSPVGLSNNSTNNNSYKIPEVITNVGFLSAGYNGTSSPVAVSDYWIWKFNNRSSNNYTSWQHVRSNGTMFAGEGFSMKGPGNGSIADTQDYIFNGKPNNGDINLTISAGNDYLVGNPYPSALDAVQFILDNGPTMSEPSSFNGTLYFWEHWGGGSHVIGQYQGGYATYSLSGGVPAVSMGTTDPLVATGGTPTKTPGRYIPVSQGFFVVSETGGTIKFNNTQRVFQKEDGTNSVFTKSSNTKTKASKTVASTDTRMKLRIGFNSINTMHRQLLITLDENASEGYDWGYDSKYNDTQIDDMYWLINDEKFIIQGTNAINEQTIIPIGLHSKTAGFNSITIDELENTPNELNIYLHDKDLNIYHDLKQSKYETYLDAGEYLNRFEITFSNVQALDTQEIENKQIEVYFSNQKNSIVINNPTLKLIKSVEMFNILGQSLFKFETDTSDNHLEYKANQIKTGNYILKIETEFGTISKKVLKK